MIRQTRSTANADCIAGISAPEDGRQPGLPFRNLAIVLGRWKSGRARPHRVPRLRCPIPPVMCGGTSRGFARRAIAELQQEFAEIEMVHRIVRMQRQYAPV
jgi:hypothetical protein